MKKCQSCSLGAIIKVQPQVTFNDTRTNPNGKKLPDGIEIRFGGGKPIEEVRELLKAKKFRYSEKQKMWYALDTPKTRFYAYVLSQTEVEVDDAQYEKRNFWKKVESISEYEGLRSRTEFTVKGKDKAAFYYSKSHLERIFRSPSSLIEKQSLYYKRYYNVVIGEDDPENESEMEQQENEMEQEEDSLLELEAEAELELLKMRVENERKKKIKSVEGLPGSAGNMQEGWEVLDFH